MKTLLVMTGLVVQLAGCAPSFQDDANAEMARMTAKANAQSAERQRAREEAQARRHVAASPAREDPPTPPCESTRPTRIAQAKEAIQTWRAHVTELAPLVKWADSHHCELRDNSGTYLVSRKREAGGVRVAVKEGEADEVHCDTPKIKDGVDADLLRTKALWEQTSVDDVMFESSLACDAKETPSLRLTYGDTKAQDVILALP